VNTKKNDSTGDVDEIASTTNIRQIEYWIAAEVASRGERAVSESSAPLARSARSRRTPAPIGMPEISRFLGIVIGMFFREHGVPHFHAVYGEYKITVEIESGKVRGEFPPRAERLVLEWAALHTRELLDNWERARQRQALERIAPLE
jgi:Domain of unknown function (DUF4160)